MVFGTCPYPVFTLFFNVIFISARDYIANFLNVFEYHLYPRVSIDLSRIIANTYERESSKVKYICFLSLVVKIVLKQQQNNKQFMQCTTKSVTTGTTSAEKPQLV